MADVFPKDSGVQASQRALQPSDPALGRRASRCLALKASMACLWENYGAVGNRDSTLKDCKQNLILPKTQLRGRYLKEAWVRPTC